MNVINTKIANSIAWVLTVGKDEEGYIRLINRLESILNDINKYAESVTYTNTVSQVTLKDNK